VRHHRDVTRLQAGNVLVLVALALMLLIAVAGLVIDSGRAYLVRTRLAAAADAAAIAALRAAARNDDADGIGTNAQQAASAAFHANFPLGWFGARPDMQPPLLSLDAAGLAAQIDATAAMPVGLMAVAGFSTLPVQASAQRRRRGIDVALALDLSAGQAASVTALADAAGLLLHQLSPLLDRVALVRFGYGAQRDASIVSGRGFDRAALLMQLSTYRFEGCANTAEGLWQGKTALSTLADPARPRALVLFAGNAPGALASHFRFTDPADCMQPGVLSVAADGATLAGLWHPQSQASALAGGCSGADLAARLAPDALPDWYDAHGEDRGIPIPAHMRAPTPQNLRRAARLVSAGIAGEARAAGIQVHVIGLGAELDRPDGGNGGDGMSASDLLRCLANAPDAQQSCRDAAQPVGLYCAAQDGAALKSCAARIAAELLRGAY
jgi:Flp pilus assembly protein TadG